MNALIENLIHKIKSYRYHYAHKKHTESILSSIETVKGKTNPKLIKLADEYANDVLGWHGYAPWLYVYSAVSGRFKEGWIPDNYYGRVVVPAIKGSYGNTSNLKPLTNKLFKSDAFPDIAYYVNGLWISKDYNILHEENVEELLFKNSKTIVYKIDKSLQGRGVFFFERTSFKLKEIQKLGNGIFQNCINQHPFFKKLMPASVVTLRITTVLDNAGDASARACYLRIGRTQDTHVKSASHIRVPVDLSSGELNAQGYLTNWLTVDTHPDTNVIFAKERVPSFNKCLSTALNLHKSMPFVQCIGWDMIVDTDNEVKIMEWNGGHNDIKFSEATQGPCFSNLGWEKLWHSKAERSQ